MIPDHIIEKAARAKFYRAHPEYPAGENHWENVSESYRQLFRDSVTRTLAPVYADIKAEALREAAKSYQLGGWALAMPSGSDRPALILGMAQRAIDWLRVRADELDGGKP